MLVLNRSRLSALADSMRCFMKHLKTRTQQTIGRPRVVGSRLPALEQVFQNPKTIWQPLRLLWYGQGERTVEICTGTALWYRSGCAPLPIRWVLTRDPVGKHPPKTIFSTDPAQPAEEIITDFMKRWRMARDL
jgi:hypothetical protein